MMASNNFNINGSGVNDLKSEVEYRTKLQDIGNKIYAASNLDEILVNLKNEITSLFDADRITVYVVDGKTRELVSRFKSGTEIAEIRIPVSISSIAGYAAFKQRLLNIKNVYDDGELASIDRELKFDKRWDKKTGFVTKQNLAFPIIYKKYLLGVIQLINRKDGSSFKKIDEQAVEELSKILGIALYNQKRMAKSRTTKFDYLLENHILTQKELEKAIGDARQRKVPVENILVSDLKIPKKEVGKSLGEFYKVPYAEYNPTCPIPGDLLVGLRVPFMRNNLWVPIRREGENIMIAIDNPHDIQKIDEIKTLFMGKSLIFSVALKQDILDFIKLFTQDEKELSGIDDILSKLQEESEEIIEAESGVGEEDSAVVQLVNKIILDAYARRASDIHIEPYPGKENTHVRIRIDGNCTLYQTIPFSYKNAVVSRIKIMADLDIAERRKPQDGKIKFKKFGGKDIELRVATVPTQGGLEDIVMRILAAGEPLPLNKMGFSEKNFENFVSAISKPYGIMFVCGPTGSGKTTTLHSALGYINKPETKIWTAEDPVEITQKGLRQVQVKSKIGFDFAAAMRAFLRADPDVIMVGEMRDKETTHIGIEASLTGHLVLSTLHTNSAPESITRLLDMGMDPFNFADAILCILAQRLVRTLCKDCKQPYTPSRHEYDEIVREYGVESFEKN
ncbi:MAG: GspE/PulE family protein, partial [Proteobacteria bacterium]|nr:GspE/PulE family protein [Pseudomonadota bacterium]